MTNFKTNILIFISFSFAFFNTSQVRAQYNDKVVGVVGSEKVTFAELEESYSKGNLSSSYTLSDLVTYLPLYLDYKAKLMYAEDNGYFSDSTIQQEHDMYSKQAAYAYWLNNEIRPTLFDVYYDRAQYELKAFHILIAPSENASPAEIEEIKEKLQQARKDIKAGKDLEELNKRYSTVQGGRSMGGDLPWVSAGRFVKEFEDQVYALKPGEISQPFKTQFGYHIALLQDKRERTPAKLLSHIYIRSTQDSTAAIKTNNAYQLLKSGEEWAKVVELFTEDGASARSGGTIGWVSSHSNYAPSFLDQVRQLDASKEYSKPIQTVYGHHIFRIDSIQTYKSDEHKKNELMKEFEKSNYFQENNAFAVQYLLDTYGSGTNDNTLESYLNFITEKDSVKLNTLKLPKSLSEKILFSFNDHSYKVNKLHDYMVDNHGETLNVSVNEQWIYNYIRYEIDEQIIEFTLQEYPQFKDQIESYLNGLVIYRLNDDHVWSAATVDSSRLFSIYVNQPQAYTYPERPYFYMFTASRDSFLIQTKEFIQNGNSPDSLSNHLKRVSVMSDSLTIVADEPYNRLQDLKKGSFSDIFEFNNRKTMFYLIDRLPPRKMTFDEAFNRLLTEFQPEREKEWLQKLRDQYKVEANVEALKKAYQSRSNK